MPGTTLLCPACRALPFRTILRLREGDPSARHGFPWFHAPGSGTIHDNQRQAFVRWHENIAQLQENSRHCSFCHVIYTFLKDSYHYHAHVTEEDQRSLWLGLPVPHGSPLLTVHVGDAEPEVRISGNYRFATTPGEKPRNNSHSA
jgi:hypothetical protein